VPALTTKPIKVELLFYITPEEFNVVSLRMMDVVAEVVGVPSSSVTIEYVHVYGSSRRRQLLQTTTGILVGFVIQPPIGTSPEALATMNFNTQNIATAISTDETLRVLLPIDATVTSAGSDSISVALIAIVGGVSGLIVVGIAVMLYSRCSSRHAVVPSVVATAPTLETGTSYILPPLSMHTRPHSTLLQYRDEEIFTVLPFALRADAFDHHKSTANVLNYNMLSNMEL
jgi:hypothetical protein